MATVDISNGQCAAYCLEDNNLKALFQIYCGELDQSTE